MFELLKRFVLRFAKVPAEPHPPAGSPGSIRTFRAAPNYWKYLLVMWGFRQIFGAIAIVFFLSLTDTWRAATAEPDVPVTAPAPAAAAPEPEPEPKRVPEGRRARRGGGDRNRKMSRAMQHRLSGWIHDLELLGLAIFIVQVPFSLAVARLNFELRWYMVTDRSMRLREGIYRVREMTLTFANVQNITIRQGPLQRFLGLSDVVVRTAGGGGAADPHGNHAVDESTSMHIGVLRAVDDPESVRDVILTRLRRMRDGGLGDPDDRHAHHDPAEELRLAADDLLAAARALR
jgi:membrane protein YdbS with pleckstrin-like domain